MKYYAIGALAAVSTFLHCAQIGCGGETTDHARLYRACNLQARLELQPKNDRVIARIVVIPTNNLSSVTEDLDLRSVDMQEFHFNASRQSDMPIRRTNVEDVEEREIELGPTGLRIPR
ncbi:MAG: hypothetical protein QME60_09515 [Verrucomicrobiota bacterium]|nr:hypothetical protein [Verrucomicrobiota bacterium]